MIPPEESSATLYSEAPHDVEVIANRGPSLKILKGLPSLALLEAFLRQRQKLYNAIIVSRPNNMAHFRIILRAHPDWFQKTLIVYDAEALAASRDVGLRQLLGERLTNEEIDNIYQNEVSLALDTDCVIAVSEVDRGVFRSNGIQHVYVLGHTMEPAPTPSSFFQRSGFLFVGPIQEETSPNGDSMIWFLSEIWPQIRKRVGDDVTLTICGVNNSDRVRSLACAQAWLAGSVDDLTMAYDRARVFVAPTRFAAGIPHKIHEASSRGVPVVATSILARQLGWRDGFEISVAWDAASFADKCVALHEDEQLWTHTRVSALDAIRRDCSRDTFENQLSEILAMGS